MQQIMGLSIVLSPNLDLNSALILMLMLFEGEFV